MLSVGLVLSSCKKDEKITEVPNIGNTNSQHIQKSGNNSLVLYYGHETFTRNTGSPVIETRQIVDPNFIYFTNQFTLNINNGTNTNNRVSSAIIKIDGVQIFGPSDFSQNVSFLTKPISNLTANSVLEVELRGKPGGVIDLWIDGILKDGNFQVGVDGGIFNYQLTQTSLTLIIPSEACTQNEIISISESNQNGFLPLFQFFNFNPIAKILNIECTKEHFNKPVLIEITYPQEMVGVSDEGLINLFRIDSIGNELVYYETTDVNTITNTIKIEIDHFSRWTYGFFSFEWVAENIAYYIGPDNTGDLWGNGSDPFFRADMVANAVKVWQDFQCSFHFYRVFNLGDANIDFKIISGGNFAGKTTGVNGVYFKKFNDQHKITIELNSEDSVLKSNQQMIFVYFCG